MRRIKCLIFIFLVATGFLFTGELFMRYADNFQDNCYQASFFFNRLSESVTDDGMIQDFLAAGEKHDVDFFFLNSRRQSAYVKEITVYGTENAAKGLQERELLEKEYTSAFMGEVKITYKPFAEIQDMYSYSSCYFLGGQDKLNDMNSFKEELADTYGGTFPRQYGSNRMVWLGMIFIWVVTFGVTLIMTIYEVLYQRKEIMVRVMLGEDLTSMCMKNILVDTGIFAASFLIVPLLLSGVTTVFFRIFYVRMSFALFLLVNAVLHTAILKVDYKKDLSKSNSSATLLTANYTLKSATAVLLVILLANNCTAVRQGLDMFKQRDFFQGHGDYSYYRLNYKVDNHLGLTDDEETLMNQLFYQRFQDRSLRYIDMSANLNSSYPVLLINKNSMEEISRQWPEMARAAAAAENKVYVMLPAGLDVGSKQYKTAEQIGTSFFKQNMDWHEVVTYEGNVQLPAVHNQGVFESKMVTQPIFLFDNTPVSADQNIANRAMYYAYDTMYNISPEEFQDFAREFQLEDQIVVESNVLKVYEHNWEIASRAMQISIVTSLFLIVLEMILISFIIRLEYQVNSVEMALKKIHGYTMAERNWRAVKAVLASTLCGIAAAFVVNWTLKVGETTYLIWCGAALAALELVCFVKKANAVERERIPTILKGERI